MKRRSVLAGGLVAGCSNPLSRPFPEKRLFVLDVQRPNPVPPRIGGPVLQIRSVVAAPGMEGRGVISRLSENEQRSDFWNEFFSAPAAMVQDVMRRWLADSGLFAAVVDQGSRTRADLALEAVLVALVGDGSVRAAPVARVHIQALTVGLDRTPPRIVAKSDLDRRAPIRGLDAADVVAGMNVSLAAVLTGLESDLRGAGA